MRLDGLGKPPLVAPLGDQAKVQEKKLAQVRPVGKSPDSGASLTPDREPKLSQIIDLIERAKKRKKAASSKEVSEAIKKYKLVGALTCQGAEPDKQVGQTLDRLV